MPDLIYFRARLAFPDSVAATDADLASFVASSDADIGADANCPCGEDVLVTARSVNRPGDTLLKILVNPQRCESNPSISLHGLLFLCRRHLVACSSLKRDSECAWIASGTGVVQRVSRVDCTTVMVTGYVRPASSAAKETQVRLDVLNGTVGSPCGSTFAGATASTTVPTRCVHVPSMASSLHGCQRFCQAREKHLACQQHRRSEFRLI